MPEAGLHLLSLFFRQYRSVTNMAQYVWQADSPRKGAPRVLLMVREAVLLNSLKRLMVAVPNYEATINSWSGGNSVAPPGPPQPPAQADPGYEDVAPHVGAQFAQVSPLEGWLQLAQASWHNDCTDLCPWCDQHPSQHQHPSLHDFDITFMTFIGNSDGMHADL